ncbi:MAG: alpha/beta hydrolase, partial [Ferruginibacter sp.]
MLKFIFTSISFYLALCSYAQPVKPVKYKDIVFSNIAIDKNLSYADNTAAGTKHKFYLFDLYQPANDTITARRPLIIWMHGGGFKFGSKSAKGIQILCSEFAQRGYLCAVINYRLSKKNPLTNVKTLIRGCADAVQDAEKAIAFFKMNGTKFRIDTNRIILGGNSAGAMIALQAVYSNNADLALLADSTDKTHFSTGSYNPQHIAAVINFWGALFKINWLTNARVPIVSVHGSNDHVVPIGKTSSSFYGSQRIHEKADDLHIPNRLKIFEGYGHELQKHFKPLFSSAATKRRWLEAGAFAADFLRRARQRRAARRRHRQCAYGGRLGFAGTYPSDHGDRITIQNQVRAVRIGGHERYRRNDQLDVRKHLFDGGLPARL